MLAVWHWNVSKTMLVLWHWNVSKTMLALWHWNVSKTMLALWHWNVSKTMLALWHWNVNKTFYVLPCWWIIIIQMITHQAQVTPFLSQIYNLGITLVRRGIGDARSLDISTCHTVIIWVLLSSVQCPLDNVQLSIMDLCAISWKWSFIYFSTIHVYLAI